jgi:hypothetical protein
MLPWPNRSVVAHPVPWYDRSSAGGITMSSTIISAWTDRALDA